MRISDWSSDVCSSDLDRLCARLDGRPEALTPARRAERGRVRPDIRRSRIWCKSRSARPGRGARLSAQRRHAGGLETRPSWPRSRYAGRSEEHTSELQSLMRISYAVFCLKKTKKNTKKATNNT